MFSWLKLIRFPNLLMIAITLFLTKYFLINSFTNIHQLTNSQVLILMSSILLVTASGYIINDIFDVKTDKINAPKKIIIGNYISKKKGCFYYFIFSFLGLLLGCYLSFMIEKPLYSLLFIFTILGLFAYSKYFKKTPLIGNIIVSFFIALSIFMLFLFDILPKVSIINGSSYFNLVLILNGYIFFSFFTTLIREIIKDIEDINGDYHLKMKTLPILFGRKRTRNFVIFLSGFLFVIICIILQILYQENFYSFLYGFVFIFLPLTYFLYKIWSAKSKNEFHFLSNLMKFIMFFGILSMIFFKFT